jgi:hypothetical protein
MKTKSTLQKNLEKAVSRIKKEIKQCNHDWYGVIKVFENSSVACYLDAPGLHPHEPVYSFGDRQNSPSLFSERFNRSFFGKKYNRSEIVQILIDLTGHFKSFKSESV